VLAYDEQGNRVSKTVGSTRTVYLVDTVNPTGYAQVLAEFTVSGSTVEFQKAYVYGHRLLGERLPAVGSAAAEYKYYAADVLGSTRFTVQGSSGAVGTEYAYEAYGKLLGTEPATGSAYLYTGEQWDGDVQAYYLRARWYLPAIGRFTSRDTYDGSLEDPISRNKYLYCHADPVNNIDPSGNLTLTEFISSSAFRWTLAVVRVASVTVVYFKFIYDPTDRAMRKIPLTAILAEIKREPLRQEAIQKVIDSEGKLKFMDVALKVGGRLSVVLINEVDPLGQEIRNIWENPRNQRGHSTAYDEFGSRYYAARGRIAGSFLEVMANEHLMSDEGRVMYAEALLDRHRAYQQFLEYYRDEKQKRP
jgi:RHS repeat-associated protein